MVASVRLTRWRKAKDSLRLARDYIDEYAVGLQQFVTSTTEHLDGCGHLIFHHDRLFSTVGFPPKQIPRSACLIAPLDPEKCAGSARVY